jgi:primosomal replication protein N
LCRPALPRPIERGALAVPLNAVAHESMQTEANGERRVACELAAVALGPIAKDLSSVAVGARLRCRGFLARRYRTGTSVALHVNEFELLEGN